MFRRGLLITAVLAACLVGSDATAHHHAHKKNSKQHVAAHHGHPAHHKVPDLLDDILNLAEEIKNETVSLSGSLGAEIGQLIKEIESGAGSLKNELVGDDDHDDHEDEEDEEDHEDDDKKKGKKKGKKMHHKNKNSKKHHAKKHLNKGIVDEVLNAAETLKNQTVSLAGSVALNIKDLANDAKHLVVGDHDSESASGSDVEEEDDLSTSTAKPNATTAVKPKKTSEAESSGSTDVKTKVAKKKNHMHVKGHKKVHSKQESDKDSTKDSSGSDSSEDGMLSVFDTSDSGSFSFDLGSLFSDLTDSLKETLSLGSQDEIDEEIKIPASNRAKVLKLHLTRGIFDFLFKDDSEEGSVSSNSASTSGSVGTVKVDTTTQLAASDSLLTRFTKNNGYVFALIGSVIGAVVGIIAVAIVALTSRRRASNTNVSVLAEETDLNSENAQTSDLEEGEKKDVAEEEEESEEGKFEGAV